MKAVLITEDHYNALGVIRSLGEQNIQIILIILKKGNTFIEKSRYVNTVFKINKSMQDIVHTLKKLVLDNDQYFVYPLSDFAALTIDKHYNEFSSNVVVPHMHGMMMQYQDKNFVKQIAEKNGITVPTGKILNVDLFNYSDWSIFPAILKPVASIEGMKSDIVRVDSGLQMNKNLKEFKLKGYKRVLVEQFITGKDEHMVEVMGYCSKNQHPTICGIIKKIREYPIQNGSTSYAQIVGAHEGVDNSKIISFLKDTKFYGLFDIEFKYADGKAYFIECNFRNGAPGYALTKTKINIPMLWIEDAIGVCHQVNVNMTSKIYFMCEQNDVINMLKGYVPFFKWLKEYIKAKKIFFNGSDIRPTLSYYVGMVIQKITKK